MYSTTSYNPESVDSVSLNLTFQLPSNPGDLTFDWKFGTNEDRPTFFNDFFNVLVNGTPIPGFPVTINNAALEPPSPNDICYKLVTPTVQTTAFDLRPFSEQIITVTFEVSDFGDCRVDSAAFIDNLQIQGSEAI
ncbi:hypothetical protein ACFQRG_15630 [Scopulibacillus cellulosilyticus]|uniref:Uncharacterized protein n=2 Tax=Scopulibacillus cellulosilyticus TaxID=2665665 RepID=A0ABW2Q411_9BACL